MNAHPFVVFLSRTSLFLFWKSGSVDFSLLLFNSCIHIYASPVHVACPALRNDTMAHC